jgi:hypothetical protein
VDPRGGRAAQPRPGSAALEGSIAAIAEALSNALDRSFAVQAGSNGIIPSGDFREAKLDETLVWHSSVRRPSIAI